MSKQIIKISDNAVLRIKEIMSQAKTSTIGVRVGVKSGGCAGMTYIMEYATDIKSNEEIIEEKGVKILIDPKAIMYLLGTEMDRIPKAVRLNPSGERSFCTYMYM